MTTREEAARLLATQQAILAEAKTIVEHGRTILAAQMHPGERIGDDTGFCTLTKPSDVATVVDTNQLHTFLLAEGTAEYRPSIVNEADAIEVLAQHAPHLVEVSAVVPGWAVEAAKKRAVAGENIPGVSVRPGKPVLQVRPSEAVKVSAREALAAGRVLDADGVLPVGGAE